MHYLTWLKQRYRELRDRDVISLTSSTMHVASSAAWLEDLLGNDGPAVVVRWHAGSHMFGLDSLKDAIRAAFRVPAEREILLAIGASDAFRLVAEMLWAGRGVSGLFLSESPYYEPLVAIPRRFGLEPQFVERWPGVDFVDRIDRALTAPPHTAAIILSNPHNPTGDWLDGKSIARIAALMHERAPHAWLILDETFGDLLPESGVSHASIDPRIITVSSLTKAHGLPDLRCGWVTIDRRAYPDALADWVLFENIGSKLLETLSAAAFEHIDRWRADSRARLMRNRELFAAWLTVMNAREVLVGDMPPHGCVAFPRLIGVEDSEPVVNSLCARHGVLVVPGAFFGEQWGAHIRIGFGGPTDKLQQGLARLSAGLNEVLRSPPLEGEG
jgi:aspartate/methionine/tyrosine aminotransferase